MEIKKIIFFMAIGGLLSLFGYPIFHFNPFSFSFKNFLILIIILFLFATVFQFNKKDRG